MIRDLKAEDSVNSIRRCLSLENRIENYEYYRNLVVDNVNEYNKFLSSIKNKKRGYCLSCKTLLRYTDYFCFSDVHSSCAYSYLSKQPELLEWITK